jgi:flavin-dependent dehydrogenase
MSKATLDVLIVGGGPAGSTLATFLARKGRAVLVLERDEFPRFHIGESLLPGSLAVLDEMGVLPEVEARYIQKLGAVFIDGETGAESRFSFDQALKTRHHYAFQVPRDDFDDVMLKHAARTGAEVRHGWDVEKLLFEGDQAVGVVARDPGGERHEIRARLVVDSTGRDALRAHESRDHHKLPHLEDTLAVFAQFRNVPRTEGKLGGDIRIVLTPRCWFWLIPFNDGRTSVGATLHAPEVVKVRGQSTSAATFEALRDAYEPMRRLMAEAEPVFPIRAIADYSYRIQSVSGNGWLAAGDASGFIDPLFSTGIHLAIQGARVAFDHIEKALDDNDVSRERWIPYEKAQRRAVEIFMGAVQAYYRGELAPLLLAPDHRWPYMHKVITSILSGDVYYDDEPRWLREFARKFPCELPANVVPQASRGAN